MNNERNCVISGIGLATPAGCEIETAHAALAKGLPLFQQRRLLGEEGPIAEVSQVDDSLLDHGLTKRQARKIDRFSLLAIAAVRSALRDAGIEVNDQNRDSLGMIIGNATGGWSFVEPIMYGLYTEGTEAVNAYVATAWFPAAPQGEISILLRLGGYSKTVSADRASAGQALEQAMRVVQAGRQDMMLAGGSEAPLNGLVFNAYQRRARKTGGYRLGEGAAFLLVEDAEHARTRGSKVYGRLVSMGRGPSQVDAMREALELGRVGEKEVDCVILDARDEAEGLEEECRSLTRVFGAASDVWVSAPKSLYGDLIGAGMAVDAAVGCLSLNRQEVLPTAASMGRLLDAQHIRHVVGRPEPRPLRHVLVHGRDDYGQSLVMLLARP